MKKDLQPCPYCQATKCLRDEFECTECLVYQEWKAGETTERLELLEEEADE